MEKDEHGNVVSPFLEELHSLKVLFFMEAEPLSDKFFQIVLNQEDFKKATKALQELMPKHKPGEPCPNCSSPNGCFTVMANDEVMVTLPNVKDSYSEEEIAKMKNNERHS